MADKKISQLTPASILQDNGAIPIEQGGNNFKLQPSALLRPEKLLSEFDTAEKKQNSRNNLDVYSKSEVYQQSEVNNLLSEKATRQKNDPNGFYDRNEITLSWNEATRTLTIQKVGVNFSFFIRGQKYTKTTNESIQIANTTGSYFIYYDLVNGVPTLQSQNIFTTDLILEKTYVAYLYWNAGQSASVPDLQIETHGSSMSGEEHLYNHTTTGTAYVNGLALSFDTTGTGTNDGQTRFSGASGIIADEDIQHLVNSKASLDNLPIIYRIGSEWRVNKSNNFIGIKGATYPYYNQNISGNWQLTEMSANSYGIIYIFVCPGITNKWFILMGQNQYGNINSATDASKLYPDLGTLPLQEFKLVGSAIFDVKSTYANTLKSAIQKLATGVDYYDWRKTSIAGQEANILSSDIVNLSNKIDTVNTNLSSQIENLNSSKADKTITIQANNGLTATGGNLGVNTTISGVDSSITTKGVVQLTNNEGTEENLAITPKGLNDFLNGNNLKEKTEDTIASAIQNTDSIKKTYDDLNNAITFNLAIQNLASDSVNLTIDGNGLKGDIKPNSIVDADINTNAGILSSKLKQSTFIDNTSSLVDNETLDNALNKIQYQAKNAFHKSTSNEISSLTEKTTIIDNDIFLAENSSSSFGKVKVPSSVIAKYIKSKDINVKNLYVSINGDDNNNGYSPNNAFATLSKAKSILGNTGEALIWLLGAFNTNETFTQLNVDIKGDNANEGASTGTSGTITSSNSTSSQRYSNLVFGGFVKNGNGQTYLNNVNVNGTITDSSSGYLEYTNGSIGNLSITGASIKVFENFQLNGTIEINNSLVSVSFQCGGRAITLSTINSITLTAGTLAIRNAVIYCPANTIFGTSGFNLLCDNVQFIDSSTLLPQTINIPAGVNYSLQNCEYNILSSLNGNDISSTRAKRFGNLYIKENLDVGKNINVGQNLIVNGDLTVNGTTTTIDTTNMVVEDKNIEIGKVANPTDTTANGGGITLKGTIDKTITYNNTTKSWDLSENVNLPTGKTFSVNNVAINVITETLQNKTLNLDVNTIQVGAEIIDKNNILNINTLTSNAQNQLNQKQPLNSNLSNLSSATLTGNKYKVLSVNTAENNYSYEFPVKSLTTAQRDALVSVATDYIIYNSTDDKFQLYNGTSWVNIVSAGTGNVSVSGLTGATDKAVAFKNDNGTSVGLVSTLAQKQSFNKNISSVLTLTTADRNSLGWVDGDVIFNTTNGTLETYRNGEWYANYSDRQDFIDWINNGVNAGFTMYGNAAWNASLTSIKGLQKGIALTTATNAQKGIAYRNLAGLSHKRLKCTINLVVGGGNNADGIWFSFFANAIPSSGSDTETAVNNSYCLYFSEFTSTITLFYNGTSIYSTLFSSYEFGGLDHKKTLEIDLEYDRITQLMTIKGRFVGTYGGAGTFINYKDSTIRNLAGSYFLMGARTGGFNNWHIVTYASIEKLN